MLYPIVRLSNGDRARDAAADRHPHDGRTSHEQIYTPEELQLIVEESERGGALRRDSSRIVRELFEFGDLTAAQVMVPRVRVAGIPVGATAEDLRRLVISHRRTRYAVYEGDLDHIVGMVHVKDLLRRLTQGGALRADDARRMPVVPETASLDDVLATMQRGQAHMAVVIDEHGGTAGIVGLEDIFEEVVGEIDEGVPATAVAGRAGRRIGSCRRDGAARRARTAFQRRPRARGSGQRERSGSGEARPAARQGRPRRLRPAAPRSDGDVGTGGQRGSGIVVTGEA